MDDAFRQDGALAGAWVLVVGGDLAAGARLRARLAAVGCSAVELAGDVADAVERTAAAPLRRRMDPLGLGAGPPVVAVDELPGLPAGEAGDGAVLARLADAVELHRLRQRTRELESLLATASLNHHRDLEAVRREALERLARTAEYRDDNTWEHTQRVAATAARLGRRLGMDDGTAELVRLAAPLHDLGKVAIPEYILLKPDRLTDEEFEVVKTHAAVGAAILRGGDSELVQLAERIAATHHERWDGTGYPEGLRGADIPLAGRLVAVADTFDVLVHERPWKEEWTVEDAAAEIRRSAGTHFDPAVVEAFEDLGAPTLLALADEL
jgi:putative nucleotidyltransferase with HDIG domain